MASKLEILSLFGFTRDPFFGHEIESADAIRVKKLLGMAISARAQISIIGERGIGKSRAVNASLRDFKGKVIRVLTPDKARVTANDIQEAMLVELAPSERIRQDREIRIRQLRRILGEASQKGPVVVIIEEAHRLHGNTLRSLKNIRELDWMGETHLFTAILIGQSDSTQNIGLAEVRLRTETVHMHGLTHAEILDYIRATVGSVFSDEAISAVAALQDARNYLDLQAILVRAMSNALAAGRDRVTPEDVAGLDKPAAREIQRSSKSPANGNSAVQSVLNRRKDKPLRPVEGKLA